MPELPEVETIKRGLDSLIVHRKILKVEVDPTTLKSFRGDVWDVEGAEVVGLRRRGKALLVDLSNGKTLLIHLRMTGQLIWRGSLLQTDSFSERSTALKTASAQSTHDKCASFRSNATNVATSRASSRKNKQVSSSLDSYDWTSSPCISSPITSSEEKRDDINDDAKFANFAAGHPSKNFMDALPNGQTRVTFVFEGGKLFFNDQRKFGFVQVLDTDKVEQEKFIAGLGKEPWEMQPAELFAQCQRHAKAPIKAVLLDQKVIAGIGNIYADESLFYAQVHPAQLAGTLSERQVAKILEGACRVMNESIDSGGSTMATYVRPDGSTGNYLEMFAQVFRRDGEPCVRCGEIIQKIRVAGRGTHFCAHCQQIGIETDYDD